MLKYLLVLIFVTLPVLSEELLADSNRVDISDTLGSILAIDSSGDTSGITSGVVQETVSVFIDSSYNDSADSSGLLSIMVPEDELQRSPPVYLYPGISSEQDSLASQVVHQLYSFEWDEGDRMVRKMQRVERKGHLPPLSYLLVVSGKVIRIQNGEFENERERRKLLEEIAHFSKIGLKLSEPAGISDTLLPTYLLIHSGIKGFNATLKISSNPVEAAIEGLGALKLLEKLIAMEPSINDAYLGLGIFYCALAKAPAIVRGALNVTGISVSFDKGLQYLRNSAYQGRYTSETAKQYLIQFLSPYWGHLVEEKSKIFDHLLQTYPQNPYYLFLQTDENICFHRDLLTERYGEELREKFSTFKISGYSKKRYLNLLKWQYSFFDSGNVELDYKFPLREFAYYPAFLNLLQEKMQNKKEKGRLRRDSSVLKILESSQMSLNRKNFFTWHVRDALGNL